jgi:hypothetical protein
LGGQTCFEEKGSEDTQSKLEFTIVSEINARYRHSEMLEVIFIDIPKVEIVFLEPLSQNACDNMPTTNIWLTMNQTKNNGRSEHIWWTSSLQKTIKPLSNAFQRTELSRSMASDRAR